MSQMHYEPMETRVLRKGCASEIVGVRRSRKKGLKVTDFFTPTSEKKDVEGAQTGGAVKGYRSHEVSRHQDIFGGGEGGQIGVEGEHRSQIIWMTPFNCWEACLATRPLNIIRITLGPNFNPKMVAHEESESRWRIRTGGESRPEVERSASVANP
ncbi:hypothetical protein B0H14DRAFT_3133742 [Mycena olivaceomarginata]|nr:hypothetical protein B0H14DRAFT_3133742 [Mycena olivaceomarginata]